MLTDPVADMLTRIRNANKALHDSAEMPSSKLKVEIARILKEEGYIRDFHVSEGGGTHPPLVVELKYGRGRERVLSGLRRVSKPGRRIYAGKSRRQRVLGGMGIAIMSTSRGVVTSRTAEIEGIGGEVLWLNCLSLLDSEVTLQLLGHVFDHDRHAYPCPSKRSWG